MVLVHAHTHSFLFRNCNKLFTQSPNFKSKRTPRSLGSVTIPQAKPSLRHGLDTNNIIPASAGAAKPSKRTVDRDEDGSPDPKRRRTQRQRHDNPMMYSVRYHPMDESLYPSRAAKVKASARADSRDDDPTADDEDLNESDDPGEVPSTSSEEADFNRVPRSKSEAVSKTSRKVRVSSIGSTTPSDRRRSSRTAKAIPPNYDMK